MKKQKINKGKYLVLYKGEEVLISKECIKNMQVEAPDSIIILEKDKNKLSDKEKLKGK